MKIPRANKEAHEIDIIISQNIKSFRVARGMSRVQLAAEIGFSHQNLAKIEKATNRVSCGILGLISKVLKVPVSEFYSSGEEILGLKRSTLELMKNYARLDNKEKREAIGTLCRVMV